MATRLTPWRLADIIDYECFLNADDREPAEALHRRDRAFFLEQIEPHRPPPPEQEPDSRRDRRDLLRRWLDCRRRVALERASVSGQDAILPGDAFWQIRAMTRWTLIALGALIGWGMAAAALAYSANAEPINAFTFFVEFAAAQAVILLGAFLALAAKVWFPGWKFPSLMRLLLRLMAGLARNLWRRNRVRVAGATRQNAEAVFGILRSRNTLYGGIFVWSLLTLTQTFVISFNCGVLGAMTARHLFHDLDFGWESTWLNADEVARGVRIAAVPWSWAIHPGHPDPAQVAGSQNRKRGSAKLDPESLKSWSHFLFGAVICYGLLPRVALLLFAARAQSSALGRLRFGDGRSALVLSRMRTPVVQTLGVPSAGVPAPTSVAAPPIERVVRTPDHAPPRAAVRAEPVAVASDTLVTPPRRVDPPAPVAKVAAAAVAAPAPKPAVVPEPPPARPRVSHAPIETPQAPPIIPAPRIEHAPPTRAAPVAEPLLFLNLTGRPFTEAQAAHIAGRPEAKSAAVSLFEAGALSLEEDEQAFATLRKQVAAHSDALVFVLLASWTAPMIASKLLLDQVRASVGPERLIHLALIGRPAPDGSFKPVRHTDRELWTAAIQARGDAFLLLL